MSRRPQFHWFLEFSVAVTGFSRFDLQGTGQAELYFAALNETVDPEIVADLLGAFQNVAVTAGGLSHHLQLLKSTILADDRLGPVGRNVIKMWYSGTWYQLPVEWRTIYGAAVKDETRVVSPSSYTEGLLWRAIGANPAGAKPPGYGAWADAPTIPQAKVAP